MTKYFPTEQAVRGWFAKSHEEFSETERRIMDHAARRKLLSKDVNRAYADDLTFGQRLADKVALFGGSWAFILSFVFVLLVWTGVNTLVLKRPFDPYPFIFLNLLLSMIAAIQAPVIMMSQNRQATKDRLDAAHDYEVNLKAEIEIMALHEKIDQLRGEQVAQLLARQREQIALLAELLAASRAPR
jgi:uncharacterized membrane protein